MGSPSLLTPLPDLTSAAHAAFQEAARASDMDPDNIWVGGYADYEWQHLRQLLRVYDVAVDGQDILELGCNVGGSSVVLAALGGRVSAIDIDPAMVRISQANISRHNMEHGATATHVQDTRNLLFSDDSFDHVIANSVLEYVAPSELSALITELHRVLKPGGILFICGTASRVAPREIHSGRLLINYVPRIFDRLLGKNFQRGLSPFLLGRSTRGLFKNMSGDKWIAARETIHGNPSPFMKLLRFIGRLVKINPGWMSPHIELVLRKKSN